MTKKLFIVGAGASKDSHESILLGCDIITEIKFLKETIYFQLLFLVVNKIIIKTKNIQEGCLTAYFESIFKRSDFLDNYRYADSDDLAQRIKGYITSIIEYTNIKFSDEDQELIISQAANLLIGKNKSFPYLARLKTVFVQKHLRLGLIEQKILFEILEGILDFIFEPIDPISEQNKDLLNIIEEFKSELKRYVVNGIILSDVVGEFDNKIHSIDHLMNFLPSISCYSDEYCENFKLPNVDEMRKFTTEYVANIVAQSIESFPTKENWVGYVEKDFFSNHQELLEEKIKNLLVINFNYDPLFESYFSSKDNKNSNAQRNNALKKVAEKLNDSHVYGYFKSYGEYGSLFEYVSHYLFWFLGDYTREHKDILFDMTEEINSIGQLNKIKENLNKIKSARQQIKLIRTDLDQQEINKHFNKIKEADKIYILGFGFDEWNLRNIGIFNDDLKLHNQVISGIKYKKIYVTNYGDLPRIRLRLEEIFGVQLHKESEITEEIKDHEGNKKLKTYSFWRSKSKEGNGQGNQVFVSTKPVYRALTEDFI